MSRYTDKFNRTLDEARAQFNDIVESVEAGVQECGIRHSLVLADTIATELDMLEMDLSHITSEVKGG